MYDRDAAKSIIQLLRKQDVADTTCCRQCRETAIRKWDSIEIILDHERFNEFEAWQKEARQAMSELAIVRESLDVISYSARNTIDAELAQAEAVRS